MGTATDRVHSFYEPIKGYFFRRRREVGRADAVLFVLMIGTRREPEPEPRLPLKRNISERTRKIASSNGRPFTRRRKSFVTASTRNATGVNQLSRAGSDGRSRFESISDRPGMNRKADFKNLLDRATERTRKMNVATVSNVRQLSTVCSATSKKPRHR